jgi:hypothetical protein
MNETEKLPTLTVVVAVVGLLWTVAAVATLVYWSGLTVWALGLLAAAMFVWTLRVYLRPSETRSGA